VSQDLWRGFIIAKYSARDRGTLEFHLADTSAVAIGSDDRLGLGDDRDDQWGRASLWSLREMRYTPGVATAPLLLVLGAVSGAQLRAEQIQPTA